MHRLGLTAAIIVCAATIAAASDGRAGPPDVKLTVAPPFTSLNVKRYRAGEDTVKSPPFRMVTTAAMTEYFGSFGRSSAKQSEIHGWSVSVYATRSEKVAAAAGTPNARVEALVKEGPGLLNPEETPYLVARIRHKQLSWGKAVSFLSQSTQDLGLYVPHNGHLQYEVWGVTSDDKYTVIARASISHPNLANWEDPNTEAVRVAPSMQALRRDRDYKRVEACDPDEFTPSLTAFDRMLDSLKIK